LQKNNDNNNNNNNNSNIIVATLVPLHEQLLTQLGGPQTPIASSHGLFPEETHL
jgi:hypothetical protein